MSKGNKNNTFRCQTCGEIYKKSESSDKIDKKARAVPTEIHCPTCGRPISEVNSHFLVYTETKNSLDIILMENNNMKSNAPSTLSDFYSVISDTNHVIKRLDIDDEEDEIKLGYVHRLMDIARIGLVGKDPDLNLARVALDKLKKRILINEGGKIKNKQFLKLGIRALIIGLIALGIAIALFYTTRNIESDLTYAIHQYFFVFAGAMGGAWTSFGVRKMELKFDDLSVMEKDRLNPTIRLIFIGVISMMFVLFLNSDFITLAVGSLTIEAVMDSIDLQILVGIIAGLAGNKLATRLYNLASDAIKKTEE
jgi:rubredoxin